VTLSLNVLYSIGVLLILHQLTAKSTVSMVIPESECLTMLGENVSVCYKMLTVTDKNLGTNNLTVPGYYVMDNVVKTG